MIGCVLATVGVIGLLKMAHHRRHGYWYGCGGGWGRRFMHHHHHLGHRGFGRGYGWGDDGFGPDGFGGSDGREGPDGHEGPEGPGAGGGGGRGRGWGRHFILSGVLDRLEATPAQERVIGAAVDEFRAEAAKLRSEVRKSRGDVAAAFRKPQFDEVILGELYARHDTAIEGVRRAFVGLGAKVHDALEEKQRARLADLIEAGPGRWGRGFFRSRWNRGGFDQHPWD
jgi:hypothetical protein